QLICGRIVTGKRQSGGYFRIGHNRPGASVTDACSRRAIRVSRRGIKVFLCKVRQTPQGTSPALRLDVRLPGNGEARRCTCSSPIRSEQIRLDIPTDTKTLPAGSVESHRRLAPGRELSLRQT